MVLSLCFGRGLHPNQGRNIHNSKKNMSHDARLGDIFHNELERRSRNFAEYEQKVQRNTVAY